MMQAIESQLSENDMRLIEVEQFGAPLRVYTLRAGYIYFMRIMGIFCLLIAAVLLIGAAIRSSQHYPLPDILVIVLFLLVFTSCLFFGWFFLYIEPRRAQREHIIACEEGLLQTGMGIRGKNIETIYWTNVRRAYTSKFGLSCIIICLSGPGELRFSLYKDMEGLANLIRERIESK